MPEPVSPPPSANPDLTHTASGQSHVTETRPTSDGGPSGLAFGPPAAAGEVGTLGPYRVVKELGKGGMGAVYLATDTRLKRKIALKVMLPTFAADAAAKERFLREAQAAAQVSHDNVVTVFEADERNGVPYIAMQFLEGVPLDKFLKTKPRLTVMQILRLVREAALGLSAAHKIGLVHRDIKPGNLWLEAPGGRVKVLDFGLARPVHAEHELTQSGAVIGTPAYMSPEQARGIKVDHRTDLFSLGALMYRLCTGELPFQGPTTMSVLMALGIEEPTAVRERNPEIPEPVAALVHQLLSKKPEHRPQTADEVAKRIRAIAEELTAPVPVAMPSHALPQVIVVPVAPQPEPNAFADLDVTEAEPAASVAEETPEPVRKKPGKGVWIGAGFAALLAVVAATVVIIIKNKDGTETKIEVPDGAGVTIKDKDGKVVAQVPPAGKQAPVTTDADRKVAEWVLSIGGSVRVNGGDKDIKTAPELPKEPFSLTGVNLFGKAAVTDDGLAHIKNCKSLVVLDLNGTKVTDAWMVHLKELKGLAILSLNSTGVTDAGLVHLKDSETLTRLHLDHTSVTDAGLVHLKECKGLTHLHLMYTKVSDVALTHLKECKALTYLHLDHTRVTDAGLGHLKDCKHLTHLWLSGTNATDAGLTHLKDCKGLAFLGVQKTKVTAQGLADLAAALPGCRIEHDGGVIEPKLSDDRKAAEWVISVGGYVWVNGERRSIRAAPDLPKEPFRLTNADLNGNYVKGVTDAGLAVFDGCKNLTSLTLHLLPITDAGLAHFKDCKSLTYLDVSHLKITDTGLEYFKDCKSLTYLGLSATKVTDAGLANFKECKSLMFLGLDATKVTDVGLAHFRDCKDLRELRLNETKVTDAGLANFKDCKELRNLKLNDTAVTDAGLALFKECKNLTELRVKGTKVTPKLVEEFAKALPACKIEHDGGVIEPKK